MKVTIQPSGLRGSVRAPASKSSMQRACAAALLHQGETVLHHPGHSQDDLAAKAVIRALGADVQETNGDLHIRSAGYPASLPESAEEIDCGESGLGIRMFTPLAALAEKRLTITGRGSLRYRPMDYFDTWLPRLGVTVSSRGGKLPLTVEGPLRPADIEVDGSLSSQFLTGLLLAYSAAAAENVTIRVRDLRSRPYIDLTLDVMQRFGMRMPQNENYQAFHFEKNTGENPSPGKGRVDYTVESDWSGAAFLLVAGAIAGPLKVTGLDLLSKQADKAIVEVLMSAHAGIAMEAKGIHIHPGGMNGFTFDATDCPDLFPPLVALAAYCRGETVIGGVSRLIHKESNRALSLQEEFRKMGLPVVIEEDKMIISGGRGLTGARVHSHHDHRIAMACAVAALGATGETIIEEAGAVRKSYPDFFQDLKSLGAAVSLPLQQYNL